MHGILFNARVYAKCTINLTWPEETFRKSSGGLKIRLWPAYFTVKKIKKYLQIITKILGKTTKIFIISNYHTLQGTYHYLVKYLPLH